MKLNDNQHFLLTDVYLEDLKSIVSIYRNGESVQGLPLNDNFGIPVCVARQDRQIVACFFLCMDASDQANITSHIRIDQRFEGSGIEQLFHQKVAEKIRLKLKNDNAVLEADQDKFLGYAYGFERPQLFKAAVTRFVNWLNACE